MILLLGAVLFNCTAGVLLARLCGFSPLAGAAGMNMIGVLAGGALPSGVARAGVYKEIWTG